MECGVYKDQIMHHSHSALLSVPLSGGSREIFILSAILQGEAVALTSDHSPDRPDEKERIESEGGAIISNSLGEPQVSMLDN